MLLIVYFSVSLSHRRSTQFLSKLNALPFLIYSIFLWETSVTLQTVLLESGRDTQPSIHRLPVAELSLTIHVTGGNQLGGLPGILYSDWLR